LGKAVTDAEALKILQEFSYAKPVRLQQAVSHIEARMLTLADIASLAQGKVDAPDYTFPIHDTGAAAAPEYAKAFVLSADTTSDATLPVSPGSRFDAGAG
jgi:hypothetical protein